MSLLFATLSSFSWMPPYFTTVPQILVAFTLPWSIFSMVILNRYGSLSPLFHGSWLDKPRMLLGLELLPDVGILIASAYLAAQCREPWRLDDNLGSYVFSMNVNCFDLSFQITSHVADGMNDREKEEYRNDISSKCSGAQAVYALLK
jgi:hypothetical protein